MSVQEATEAAKKKQVCTTTSAAQDLVLGRSSLLHWHHSAEVGALQAELEANIEAAKKTIKGNEGSSRDADFMDDSGTLEMMEMEDRSVPPPLGGRPKRRR